MVATPTRQHGRKTSLLATCGSAALALGLIALPQSARADGFNASPAIIQGTVVIDRTVPNQDTITVTGLDAVVDWRPTEGSGSALTFLPNGNTVTYQGTVGATDFAIINRILPSADGAAPLFDGHVISVLRDGAGGTTPGGTVMFYSASGLAIGPKAVFDVGRLFLSSLNPDITTFDDYLAGTGPLLFSGGTRPVVLANGSQINAPSEGSYLVVTAPEIEIRGDATINGSVAYIAGEELSLAYDAGLFDIAISVGTSSANPIQHFGSTGGPASLGAADPHVIYGVARGTVGPFELLFRGNLGFDPAASATIENGVIVLSANYNVSTAGVLNDFTRGTVTSASEADLLIGGSTITSDLVAHSSNFAQIGVADQTTVITGDVFLYGRSTSQIRGDTAGLVDITGDVVVSANAVGITAVNVNSLAMLDATGGLAQITATPSGRVTITGNASVLATGQMGLDSGRQVAGNAAGGIAEVRALGGPIDISGTLLIDASAISPVDFLAFNSGGFADGGTANLRADSGGVVTVDGNVEVYANAAAYAIRGFGDGQPVGDGSGGTLLVQAAGGGQIDLGANVTLATDGSGAYSAVPGAAAGGGFGGSTTIEALNSLSSITVGGTLTAQSNAEGGFSESGTGGLANAGNVSITLDPGTTLLVNSGLTTLSSLATGGEGNNGGDAVSGILTIDLESAAFSTDGLTIDGTATGGEGDNPGTGLGGIVLLELTSGAGFSSTGDVTLTSAGIGGSAVEGPGGNGTGRTIDVTLDNSSITMTGGDFVATSLGQGDGSYTGGDGTGGNVTFDLANASNLSVASFAASSVGTGGNGSGDGSTGPGFGGAATAGTVTLDLAGNSSFLSAGNVSLVTSAKAGSGDEDVGGAAAGGGVFVTITTDSQLVGNTDIVFEAVATGGTSLEDVGGEASGAPVRVSVNAASLRAPNGSITLSSTATGGAGQGPLGRGGDAFEAFARLETLGAARIAARSLTISGSVSGGDSDEHEGGDAITATAEFNIQGSSTVAITGTGPARPTISASVTGGKTGGGDGVGGTASGADASLTVGGTSTLTLPAITAAPSAQLLVTSQARGGSSTVNGGEGGAAAGGSASVNLTGSSQFNGGALQVLSEARGGAGILASANNTRGGAASGGAATVTVGGTAQLATRLDAAAITYGGSGTGTSAGGAASAARATLTVTGGAATLAGNSTLLSNANGGAGATGGAANSGQASVSLTSGGQLVFTGASTLLNVSSLAQGGAGTTTGGNAVSGRVEVSNDAARLNGNRLELFADAVGGTNSGNTDAGDATGGTVFFRTGNAGTSTLALLSGRSLATTFNSATATGGVVQVVAQGPGSTLTAPLVTVSATPGYGTTAASGTGGTFRFDAIDNGVLAFTRLTATVQDALDPTSAVEATTSRLQALGGGRITVTEFAVLDTSGDLLFETANGGTITGQAPPASVTGNFSGRAAGQVLINGDNPATAGLTGNVIAFTSRDVAIGAGARVAAQSLSFTSIETTAEAVLGGTTEGPGYTLTQAEMDRVFAATLQVFTPNTANSQVDLLLRDFARTGSLAPQGTANLTISTAGVMQIVGAVSYTSVASTNLLELFAGTSLQLTLPTGTVTLTGGGSVPALAGTLAISSPAIFAGTSTLLPMLVATPDAAGLSALLNDSTSFSTPVNYLAANRVEIEFGDFVLTQNTGPAGTLRGILVGLGGLSIGQNPDLAPRPARVITFGARDNGSGILTTNNAFFATVDYGDAPLSTYYSTDATLNNCNIVTQICSSPTDVPLTSRDLTEVPKVPFSLAAVMQAEIDAAFGIEFASAMQVPEGDDQGLVTDPVTSGGDQLPQPAGEDE
ncbi:MAG: hypothetical protein ABIT10_01425 [Alteraurantiacibacter sp.]